MSIENAVLSLIHDQIGNTMREFSKQDDTLEAFHDLIDIQSAENTLLAQLRKVKTSEEQKAAPKITITLLFDFVGSSVPSLLTELVNSSSENPLLLFSLLPTNLLKHLKDMLRRQLKFFDSKGEALLKLVTARDAPSRKSAIQGLLTIGELRTGSVRQLIGDEAGVVFSLATVLNSFGGITLVGQEVVEKIEQALLDYFFKKDGFSTLDGSSIVSPVHLADIVDGTGGAGTQQLKSVLSKASGEQYVRDLIRVVVEAAYDEARNLERTFTDTVTGVKATMTTQNEKDAVGQKLLIWFRGFSAMAESTAMRTVEMATQGVSGFQTNSLVAAAAGTFAGTVARKLAQHCFLKKLQKDMN